MLVRISTQNRKMVNVPSVSLPPNRTCIGFAGYDAMPCWEECYANKSYLRTARDSWTINWLVWKDDSGRYFREIQTWIEAHECHRFRWHVGGEIPNQSYADQMVRIATELPWCQFLTFTKRHDLDYSNRTENMHVFLSMWPEWGEVDRGLGLPYAWLLDPENVDTRIPSKAKQCKGKCDACLHCFTRNNDVVLTKH